MEAGPQTVHGCGHVIDFMRRQRESGQEEQGRQPETDKADARLYERESMENALYDSKLMSSARSQFYEPVSDLDSDEALVRRTREGDFNAFERLFERHRKMVYRYAYRMTPRRDDAEDVVQEVFVRAYQNLHRYRDEAKFTTWLLRIATNLGTDRARMSHRRQHLEQQEAGSALVWMTQGEIEDPVQNLERDRRRLALQKAMSALPAHHRNMIVLRDIEEREYSDIAQILDCTIGGAKLRVLRARRALRDRIAPLLEEDSK